MKQNWTYKKLGEVCDIINGLWTGKKEPFVNVAVIRNTNFSKDCKLKLDNVAYIDVEAKQFASRKLQYGDIIIEKSGGSEKQPVGRPVLFDIIEGDYSFSNFTTTLRIKNDNTLNPKFLHNCLYAYYLSGATAKMQSKTTGLHNLDMKAFLNFSIPLPPLETQSRIVSELDLLQSIIDKQKAQLKELDNLAQCIFYDMFGDPVDNDKGWEVKKLEEVCNVGSSKRIFAEEYVESGIPFYRSKEVIELSKGLPISVELFISEKRYLEIKKNNGIPSIGDLLITAVGTIGEIWIVDTDKPFYYKDGNIVCLSQISLSISSKFLQYSLHKLIDEYKKKMAIGSAYSALTIINLKKLNIPLPPLSLQQSFAAKIEAIEKQKAAISKSIAETEKLFEYTMDKYFG